eukprot:scaffold14602_cov118-Isochrysis_galbana.AAC.2
MAEDVRASAGGQLGQQAACSIYQATLIGSVDSAELAVGLKVQMQAQGVRVCASVHGCNLCVR